MLTRTARTAAAAAAVMLAAATVAVAQPADATADKKKQARALFQQANQLYSRGMYLDALQRYREARALWPSYKIDLNIGGTLDAMGRRTEAARYFERFLINSASAPPPIIGAARERLAQLKRDLASVRIECHLEGATVMINRKSAGQTPLDLPIYLTPGGYTFLVKRQGHSPFLRQLTLAAGDHRTLTVELEPLSSEAPAAVAPPPRASSPPRRQVARAAPPPARPARHLIALGYGYASPPASPYRGGQAVSLAYAFRLGLPLAVGARALVAFSSHDNPGTGFPYEMQRFALQAEGAYVPALIRRRLQATLGVYIGWQLASIAQQTLLQDGERERQGTVLYGDAGGFRAGVLAGLRVRIVAGLWLAAGAAWGVELLHQDDSAGERQAHTFWRPQAFGEVGYAF